MTKRMFLIGAPFIWLTVTLVLASTPFGSGAAQQVVRFMTTTEASDSALLLSTQAMETATESAATSLDSIESNLSADAVHGNAVIATGPQITLEAKDQDGLAFPNTVTEGQAIRAAGSMSGVLYVMPVNEDGTAGATSLGVASAASTNATNVKASGGRVLGVYLVNTTATLYYIRFYNLASAPTCSSATGYLFSLPIPASATGAGFSMPFPGEGLAFGTGIGYCLTGGAGSTDNTNAAIGIYGVVAFK